MWGIGNTMLIFLAALLDVPRHLHESAELDGAGRWSRLRWVTLPSISPVILFALVIGVIEALQYFTRATSRRTIAAGSAGQAARQRGRNLGYPQGSTLFYPVWLYQQGFRYFNMGYASAMAMLLFVVALAVTFVLIRNSRALGPLPGPGGERGADAHRSRAQGVRPPARPRPVRRRSLLLAVADHSVLIALAIVFLAPLVFIVLTSLMTDRQALSSNLWPHPFRWRNFSTSSRRRRSCATRATRSCTRCSRRSGSWCRASRSRTRWRGCAGAAATPCSCSCWRR